MRLFPTAIVSIAFCSGLVSAVQDKPPAPPVQTAPDEVVAWLKERRAASTGIPRDVFDARVVAIGRALSGTNEIARFESSVWKLAAQMPGFEVLAVDVGRAEGFAADAYIQTGQGKASEIAASFGPWGWSTSDVVELLESLRAANAEAKSAKKTFVGIGIGSARLACEPMIEFVRKAYPEGAARTELIAGPMRADGRDGRSRYFQADENERAIAQAGLDELQSIARDQAEAWTQRTSAAEYERGLALITALAQYEQSFRFELIGGDSDPHGRILAENTAAALARAGEGKRALVLVHARDLARASDSDSFAAQIEKYFQIKPVCIATAVGEAEFQAYDPNDHAKGPRVPRDLVLDAADKTPLESALARTGAGAATIDLRKTSSTGPAAEWFAKMRALRSARPWIGGPKETPWDYFVTRDFDLLVWFDRATNARKSANK
jgi:erythromycin esterase-like protein